MTAHSRYAGRVELHRRWWRAILGIEGAYLLVTGVWPLVWMEGFLAVTGPKQELWLVRTVGLLAVAIGAVLVLAALRETYVVEIAVLGVATALAFLAVDVLGWASGVLRWTYLLDAFVQGLILVGWAMLAGVGLSRRSGF